jgi:hypothetical protein
MTDVYVYYFMRCGGQTDDNVLSNRRATLEAIKGKGEAVMESQIVVDHTEVDGNGFLIGGVGNKSLPMDELWSFGLKYGRWSEEPIQETAKR